MQAEARFLLRTQRRQESLAHELRRAPSPADRAPASAELSPALTEALASLSPLDREVLLLYAWEELDRGEIADVEVPQVGAVSFWYGRTRQAAGAPACSCLVESGSARGRARST